MEPKPYAFIDIDGVLADTLGAISAKRQLGGLAPMPVPESYDFGNYTEEEREYAFNCLFGADSAPFYSGCEPITDARRGIEVVGRHYEIVYITARSGEGTELVTRNWLWRHGFPYGEIVFAHDKLKVAGLPPYAGRVAFIVEDKGETAQTFAEAGIPVYLLNYPYNSFVPFHPLITRVDGWKSIYCSCRNLLNRV